MSFLSRLFKAEANIEPIQRIELKKCEYCNEMIYRGEEMDILLGKSLHRRCFKQLSKEAKRFKI